MAFEDWERVKELGHGGQGAVYKVCHRDSGTFGALKTLHDAAGRIKERRVRFATEIIALRALKGSGVPDVLDSNEGSWEQDESSLYFVMELIEGTTLQNAVNHKRLSLDQAIKTTLAILSTLVVSHGLSVLHRDLKPDNVMLRNGNPGEPILVDLGMAWNGNESADDFRTDVGQELGNRFLRLNEHAPRGDFHDKRSDVSMAVGLFFFMLTGQAPRRLIDHLGRHPHERPDIGFCVSLQNDVRWPQILRIFHIGFQEFVDLRYQSAEEFQHALASVNDTPKQQGRELEEERSRMQDLMSSAAFRIQSAAAPLMQKSSMALFDKLTEAWKSLGYMTAPGTPGFKENGYTFHFFCSVSRVNHSDPIVWFYFDLRLTRGV